MFQYLINMMQAIDSLSVCNYKLSTGKEVRAWSTRLRVPCILTSRHSSVVSFTFLIRVKLSLNMRASSRLPVLWAIGHLQSQQYHAHSIESITLLFITITTTCSEPHCNVFDIGTVLEPVHVEFASLARQVILCKCSSVAKLEDIIRQSYTVRLKLPDHLVLQ